MVYKALCPQSCPLALLGLLPREGLKLQPCLERNGGGGGCVTGAQGELPSFRCRPSGLREASEKPVRLCCPSCRRPPLGACVGKLLIDFTLVKNVNKLQMTS